MPRTEAGKRLLEEWSRTKQDREYWTAAIDAIEAEACHHDTRWIEEFTAWSLAAARIQIKKAIRPFLEEIAEQVPEEWIDPESSMAMQVTIRTRDLAAVLAAINENNTDTPITTAQLDWMDQHGRK